MQPNASSMAQAAGAINPQDEDPEEPGSEIEIIRIRRTTFGLAGKTVATHITGDPDASKNGLFYIHTDHLGSTSRLSYGQDRVHLAGQPVTESDAYYLPFGGYRGQPPSAELTDRGFTGHKQNDDLGLIYMNARFYLPEIGRFASADSIVPDTANPQSYNRYSYVRNNPLNYFDPDGHDEEPTWVQTLKNGVRTGVREVAQFGADVWFGLDATVLKTARRLLSFS